MKKNQSLITTAYIIIYVLYFILAVIFINTGTPAFWISYAFTTIAFLLVLGTIFVVKGNKTGDMFYGIPLVLLGNGYLIFQIILSIVLAIISPKARFTFAIEMIPLALFSVAAVSTWLGRNVQENQEETENSKIMYLRKLEGVLHDCQSMTLDGQLRSYLASLEEKVHYSDPISHDSLSGLESRMMELAKQIRSEVSDNLENARQDCHLLETMLADRNQKCKLLK